MSFVPGKSSIRTFFRAPKKQPQPPPPPVAEPVQLVPPPPMIALKQPHKRILKLEKDDDLDAHLDPPPEADEDRIDLPEIRPEDMWICPQCTMSNEPFLLECSVCQAPKLKKSDQPTYVCGVCTYSNVDITANQCEMCGAKREQPSTIPHPLQKHDAESKDDDEAGSSSKKFVLGEKPPPLKRKMIVREHLAFLAGVEEAFGTIQIHSQYLRGIENLVKKPFECLLKQYASNHGIITEDILNHLLKALVYRSCLHSIRIHRSLETIMQCGAFEDEELKLCECNMCHRSGQELTLHFSEACATNSERHTFCMSDTHDYIMKLVNAKQCQKILCPYVDAITGRRCDQEVDTKFIRRCLSTQEFKTYLDECFNALIAGPVADPNKLGSNPNQASYMHCPNPKCDTIMEILQPHGLVVPDQIKEVDESGKTLTREAWLHFSTHRVRCHHCHTNFCSSCKTIPYHLGRSCEEHAKYLEAKHCRFCQMSLTPDNIDKENTIPAFELVCTDAGCQAKRSIACPDLLACGHPCGGIKGEPYHPPCLNEACAGKDPNLKVSNDDLCSICWTEELGSAPIVQLTSCQHIFHAQCCVDKISKKWPGVRITFGFMDCSICKIPMNHPSPLIQAIRQPVDLLLKSVTQKALARLLIEKMDKDEKLVNVQSRYYNQPTKYAMDCFAYYNCFKCSKFYFGGRRDCEQNAAAENRPPEEFVCFDCADLKSIKCKNSDHSEYQVWKCRFCCNIASWFCFGTTHFCDPCHSDNPMEKVRRARSGFKQCVGYQYCPCKQDHAPNGPEAECEYNLGCGACAEELTKLQAAKAKEKQVEAKVKEISHSSVQL